MLLEMVELLKCGRVQGKIEEYPSHLGIWWVEEKIWKRERLRKDYLICPLLNRATGLKGPVRQGDLSGLGSDLGQGF
jgi:hypothetical protein